MYVGACGGKLTLLRIQIVAVGCNNTFGVEHHHVLLFSTKGAVKACARYGGSTCTIDNNLDVFNLFASHYKGVDKACCRYDSCAVLVVVHYRYVEFGLETLFYFEAFGCFDILEVDTAKGRRYGFNCGDKLFGVFFVHLDVKGIDACIYLEQETLAFHHRFAAHGAYVAQSEHGGAVRNDGYQVALVCIAIGIVRILLNFKARFCHAW